MMNFELNTMLPTCFLFYKCNNFIINDITPSKKMYATANLCGEA